MASTKGIKSHYNASKNNNASQTNNASQNKQQHKTTPMKNNLQKAYILFYQIFLRDKKAARQILNKLSLKDLQKLNQYNKQNRVAKKGKQSIESQNKEKIYGEIQKSITDLRAKTDSLYIRQQPANHQPAGNANFFHYVIFFVTMAILAIFLISHTQQLDFWKNLALQEQLVLSFFGFLLLIPFLWIKVKNRQYFTGQGWKNLWHIESWLWAGFGFLILTGLMAIVNYWEKVPFTSDKAHGISFMAFVLFFAMMVGPWVEEVFFRGIMFDWIAFFHISDEDHEKKNWEAVSGYFLIAAIFISAFAFALVHQSQDIVSLLLYLVAGVVLAWQRYAAKTLWVPFISHSLANGTILFLG